jgi:phage tail-like protein
MATQIGELLRFATSPVQSYRYRVMFTGLGLDIGFARVSGLKLSAAFEPLEVGGKNDGPALLPVSLKDPERTTFEKGRQQYNVLAALKPGSRFDGIDLHLLNEEGSVVAIYSTDTAVVESMETSDLDATSGEVLIEKYTILHTGFRQIEHSY